MRRFASLLVLVSSGCIRSVGDIPGPGEGGFITGTVVQRDLQSGTFVGQPGIRVAALGTSISAITDDRGFFTLQRLPLGRVSVTLERRESDGTRSAARILDPVSVVVGGQTIDLGTIQLTDLAALEGAARIREPGADPVGVGGTLVVVAQTQFKAITDQIGGYVVAGIPEGRFDVVAFRSGYSPARAPGVLAQPGLQFKVRDLVLPRQDQAIVVSVRGTVTKADTNDGSGVEASFVDETNPGAPPVVANTDATGSFTLDLPTGVYRATFTANGYRSVAIPGVAVLEEGVVGLSSIYLSLDVDGDLDGDGIPDAEDDDRDNDGCPNEQDSFPDDAFFCVDTDGDGLPDEIDTDDDDDGLSDAEEVSPGEDGFITNPLVADTDGDGFNDQDDVCPALANPGQDPEDCSAGTITPGLEPRIRDLRPEQGGPGTVVTITGRNFAPQFPLQAVRFGFGPPARAEVDSATSMRVEVPYGSTTGTVTLIVGAFTTTSTETFTVLEPPQLLEVQPPSARPSTVIALFGRNLDVPDRVLTVDGVNYNEVPCSSTLIAQAGGRDLFCVQVPAGARSGQLVIDSANGKAERRPQFVVLPGPVVTRLAPNPAAPDVAITIYGFGFRVENVGETVEMEFATNAGTERAPVTVVNDSVALVTIPTAAVTGAVRLIHPSGDTTAPRDLIMVGDNDVAITNVDPMLIRVGDSLSILGRNLENVSRVHFAGGQSAVPTSATPVQLRVTVPAGVQPGLLEVENGGTRFASPERLSVLEVVGPIRVLADTGGRRAAFGGGYEQGQAFLPYNGMINSDKRVLVFDDQALTVTATLPAGFAGPDAIDLFFVHPTLPYAVAVAEAGQTLVLDMPSLTTRGVCLDEPFDKQPSRARPVHFAHDAPYAFIAYTTGAIADSVLAVTRIDLSTGTCTRLGQQPFVGGSTLYRTAGFVPDQPQSLSGRVFVTGQSGAEVWVIRSNPGAADDGAIIDGPISYGVLRNTMFFGPGPTPYFVDSSLSGWQRIPPPPAPGTVLNLDAALAGQPHVTANERWALIALSSSDNATIVDLANDRVVRRFPTHSMPSINGGSVAVHNTISRWIAADRINTRLVYRLTIAE